MHCRMQHNEVSMKVGNLSVVLADELTTTSDKNALVAGVFIGHK